MPIKHREWNLIAPALNAETVERFRSLIDRRGPQECWPWLGGFGADGYGLFRVPGGRKSPLRGGLRAHRIAYGLSNGGIPLATDVLHDCDNPPCCNPAHLWGGSPLENMRDMHRKGRHRPYLRAACSKGHDLTGANVKIRIRRVALKTRPGFVQWRVCRICLRESERNYYWRHPEAARQRALQKYHRAQARKKELFLWESGKPVPAGR